MTALRVKRVACHTAFELGGRCRGVPAVRSQLADPVQKVRHERGQPPTEWPRKNLQTEVVDNIEQAMGLDRKIGLEDLLWAKLIIDSRGFNLEYRFRRQIRGVYH